MFIKCRAICPSSYLCSGQNRSDHRSSRQEVFCKKGALRNFTKFTGKHLCLILFFNKVPVLRPANLFKKRLWHRCFPLKSVKLLRTPFFIEHLWWLLLRIFEILFSLSSVFLLSRRNYINIINIFIISNWVNLFRRKCN